MNDEKSHKHDHNDHNECCGHDQISYGCEQTLDELDFDKSIFNNCVIGDLDRLKQQLKSKGLKSINEQDKNGYSCLHYAARNSHYQICKYLVENGADVNLKTNSCKSTPLHRACFIGHKEIVKLLLENKANAWEVDCDGKTPMHKCVEQYMNSQSKNSQPFLDTMKILFKHDSNLIYLKDNFNKNSIDIFPDFLDLIN